MITFKITKANFVNYVVLLIVLIGVIYLIVGYSLDKSFSYDSSLFGVVEELGYSNRDPSVIVKFKYTDDFYNLISFKVGRDQRNLLQKGDSIFKPMFSEEAYIYRKDSIGNYYLNTIVKIK